MPKKKPVQKNSKKKFSVETPQVFPFKTKHRGKIILGIVLLLVLIFFGVRQVQIYQEKSDYRQAEVVLDQLYRKIESEIGKPEKIIRGGECFYSSAKLSPGILRCSTSIHFSQSIDDVSVANTRANQIVNTLKQDTQLKLSDYKYNALIDFGKKEPYRRLGETGRDYSIVGNSRHCFVSFQYLTAMDAQEFKYIISDSPSRKFIGQISCGGEAKTEYFPVNACCRK